MEPCQLKRVDIIIAILRSTWILKRRAWYTNQKWLYSTCWKKMASMSCKRNKCVLINKRQTSANDVFNFFKHLVFTREWWHQALAHIMNFKTGNVLVQTILSISKKQVCKILYHLTNPYLAVLMSRSETNCSMRDKHSIGPIQHNLTLTDRI